jgi:hypothetical protein
MGAVPIKKGNMKKTIIFISLMLFSSTALIGQFGPDTASYCLERAYLELSSRHLYGLNNLMFGDCRSDDSETGGDGSYDIPSLQELMLFNIPSDNQDIANTWFRAYNIIFFCDGVIRLAPTVGLDSWIEEQYIAEAKFIQSLMLFYLAINYDSIQIYTNFNNWKLEGTFNDYDATNRLYTEANTIAEVFSKIKQDLAEAIEDLPLRSELPGGDLFRATKGAANALMAKVYIFQSSYAKNYPGDPRFNEMTERWDLALQYAEEVINSGEYQLVGLDGETFNTWWDISYLYPSATSGYRYIFTVDGNDSPESVFAAKNLMLGQGWHPYGGNGMTKFTTCRKYYNSGDISTDYGWGFNVPSQILVNAFAEESGDAADDPRFIVNVGGEGDSLYIDEGTGSEWFLMDHSSSATGMACRKYECSPDEFWLESWEWTDGPMNIPVIRYADVILWAAEAAFETGDETKALYYINMVRQRARNSGSTGYPANLLSVSLEDIIHERQLELALEGHRFYDLVRWNRALIKLNGLFNETYYHTIEFETGRDEFLPVPITALPTSLKTVDNHNINIYPNPVKERLYVESAFSNPVVTIFDIYGRTILKKEFDTGNFSVNTGALSRGLYFISLETKGSHINLSFVKE